MIECPLLGEGAAVSSLELTDHSTLLSYTYMAVEQNQWYHFGQGAPPILELGCSLGVEFGC